MKRQYFITAVKSKYGAHVFTVYSREKAAYIVYYAAADNGAKQPRKEYKRLSSVEKYLKHVISFWRLSDIDALSIRAPYQIAVE